MTFIKSSEIQKIKQRYPIGTRVQLLYTSDPYTRVKCGNLGSVAFVDDIGTVHVNWDGKGMLGMILNEDKIVKISK